MGPLIPNEIIASEWNFVLAILIGMAFGFIMEASGFSSSRKLVGVFYGYDFAVLKVFLTACLVSLIGLSYMNYLNWVDLDQLFVQPTYLWASLIGGVIMGVGFLSGGFCPGTSLCAVGIGKIDGIVFTIGLFIGILVFSESFDWIEPIYEDFDLGHVTLDETLGISRELIIFGFTILAILAFAISDRIRKHRKKIFY
ncbi:MAG: YeeE/YedE family protein [Flavobacteriaceae bacterium]|nr:MAG: YeeE/YedE family protein [Flavobacteriaceae bacterium]